MKVMRLRSPGGLDNLYLDQGQAAPPPGPGEIRVRIHASSLNYHDYAVVAGMIQTPDGHIPMSDGAGVVDAVGEGVHEFVPGDQVVSTFFPDWISGAPEPAFLAALPGDRTPGYAREMATVPAHHFTRVPQGYSHAEAATLACAGLTAWRALMVDGGLKAGRSVLVQGTGGVSIFALQIAKAAGCEVVATSSSDEKLERLKAMGADHLINYRRTPDWGQEALKATGGRGVDHVVEIGGAGTTPQSIAAVRHGGHIAIIGVLAGYEGAISTAALMGKQARLQGLLVGSRQDQLNFIRAIEVNGIKPVIDCSFPLDRMADAFRHQLSGQHFGKICLEL